MRQLAVDNVFRARRRVLRGLMRARRLELSRQQQRQAAERICMQASQHAPLLSASAVALYRAFDGEVETDLLCHQLWRQQKQLYLPLLHPTKAGRLLFVRYAPDTPLQRNRFGILEPVAQSDSICQLQQLEVVIMPLVAFDQCGYRLGMGGGYYDRTLADHAAPTGKQPALHTIGLAHACQRVDTLPYAPWDLRMSAVMTPHGLLVDNSRGLA